MAVSSLPCAPQPATGMRVTWSCLGFLVVLRHIPQAWGGARDSTFLTGSQVMLRVPAPRSTLAGAILRAAPNHISFFPKEALLFIAELKKGHRPCDRDTQPYRKPLSRAEWGRDGSLRKNLGAVLRWNEH